jgi:hypothetical protein
MKSLADHLIEIKKHLSDKERWETDWNNNRVSGYTSGSLESDLGGLWNVGYKKDVPAVFYCTARAIHHLYGNLHYYRYHYVSWDHGLKETDSKCCPADNDVRLVKAFGDYNSHESLMKVLDLAIRYAKVYAFS